MIKKVICVVALISTAVACNNKPKENPIVQKDNTIEKTDFIFPQGEKGSPDFFTGNAYNYGLVPMDSTYTTLVGNVYFEPGARSNWHTHPGGQILIITDGIGYHQIEGQPVEVMHKGDVVKCPPNVRHWHGASKDSDLQQMYIVPNIEKGIVEWMEAVTDEQYNNVKN
ncbi:cupin domain-containing protein [Flavobacterium rakeshii]|uniref:cupin domain-containing protein n=1 Tax=Flavobacterium rakeshii TaxID=1038845 RepID=UPI002E7ACF6E|nr:cupin domain-containing protein [Flavobacterium rakeshii]MEE1899435.1 cupin domain-containing protein [Flavobacterium rakeshii]